MKKNIAVISAVIFLTAITNISCAEKQARVLSPAPVTDPNNTVIQEKNKLKSARINNKVTGYIDEHFTGFTGLNVYPDNGVLVSKFTMNGRAARVVFDARGEWMYTIINGDEKDLSKPDRQLLNKKFRGFVITLVQELRQENITCYKVFLENDAKLCTVYLYDGEITIEKELNK